MAGGVTGDRYEQTLDGSSEKLEFKMACKKGFEMYEKNGNLDGAIMNNFMEMWEC